MESAGNLSLILVNDPRKKLAASIVQVVELWSNIRVLGVPKYQFFTGWYNGALGLPTVAPETPNLFDWQFRNRPPLKIEQCMQLSLLLPFLHLGQRLWSCG